MGKYRKGTFNSNDETSLSVLVTFDQFSHHLVSLVVNVSQQPIMSFIERQIHNTGWKKFRKHLLSKPSYFQVGPTTSLTDKKPRSNSSGQIRFGVSRMASTRSTCPTSANLQSVSIKSKHSQVDCGPLASIKQSLIVSSL
jgi:hypothetical protein